jgi:hypothetical protein
MKQNLLAIPILLIGLMTAHAQTTITISVDQPLELEANAGRDTATFSGDPVRLGETLAATGGTEPYSFSWSDNNSFTSADANPLVNPEQNSTYNLVVTDKNSCTATDEINISISTIGINDFNEDELRIYPIPATSEFTVEHIGGTCNISLIDENGRILWTKQLHGKARFATPHNPGVYFLKINYGEKEAVRTIIITK